MTDAVLVFDIGGTSLRAAAYSPGPGTLSEPIVVPTPNRLRCPGQSEDQLYRQLLEVVAATGSELEGDHAFKAISIAFPGPVSRTGDILAAPGIWGRNPDGPIRIVDDIKTVFPGLDIFVNNDLTAAGWRYLDAGDETFCLVTVSTGIGSKVFINGRPQLGPAGTGGEIGHAKVSFSPTAPLCDCGERGHLQAYSSGRGVLELIRHQAQKEPERFRASRLGQLAESADAVANRWVAEAYGAEDAFTVELVGRSVSPLAAMLVNLYLALGIERFVLIGGFALALGEPYRHEIIRQATEICWDGSADWGRMIRFGCRDDLSGLIGAGRLASAAI